MNNQKLISVVLPTYNGEEYLASSIESVINQTYKNWELIIVNDCSSDKTLEIAQKYQFQDNRVRIITNSENKKLPASLNIGFANSNGEYRTWTSDDNEYHSEAFNKMIEFLENNDDYGMVYAKCRVSGTFEGDVWGNTPTTPDLLLQFPCIGACFLYRKVIAEKIGEYDIDKCYVEDHDYWLRLLLESPIGNIDEELYHYRRHSKSLTVMSNDKAAILRIDLTKKYIPLYLEKFPELKNCINSFTKNTYKELKRHYLLNFDIELLKKISKLGFIYFFKAVKLFIKSKRSIQ